MAGKVLASRSPWDRKTKAMTSLSPSPASLMSVTVTLLEWHAFLIFNEMVHILIVAHELL